MLAFCICFLSFLLSFILIPFWYYRKYRLYNGVKNIAHPTCYPIIGHSLDLKDTSLMMKNFMKYVIQYGHRINFMIGFDPYLFVGDNVLLGQMMNSLAFNTKEGCYSILEKWLGTGLLTSSGDKWHKRRKLITPTFHFQVLNNYFRVFDTVGNVLIDKIKQKTNKCIDVFEMIGLYTMDTICETAFGTPINAQANESSEYVKAVRSVLNIYVQRRLSVTQMYKFSYVFTSNYWKERKLVKYLHAHTYRIISNRRQMQEKVKGDGGNLIDEFGVKRKVCFLDMLLQNTIDGEPLSDEDIREEVDTFMFEGHDTVSSAISFALHCIANNSDVQEKLCEELKEIYGNDRTKPTTNDDLKKMNYLEMVIKETLRLYPSVPAMARTVSEDVVIGNDVFLKGTAIIISPYVIGRTEDYFPEPTKFDPERFSAENIEHIKPFTYIPFSAGSRNCIGQKFAMMEMKCILSKILRNFKILPDPLHELKLTNEVILKSSTGVWMQFQEK